jgi:hypothetical protein
MQAQIAVGMEAVRMRAEQSYVPSSRYIWSSAPILFLQEQIKDIIIRALEGW